MTMTLSQLGYTGYRRGLLAQPRSRLGKLIYAACSHLPDELADDLLDALSSVLLVESELRLTHVKKGILHPEFIDYGMVSRKVITDAGAAAIVNGFRNTFEIELFNFHGLGTGGAAEGVANTALTTELTTQYSTDNTRPTGTQSAPAGNQYQSVATITVDANVSITEHGLFSQAAVPGGTLWDSELVHRARPELGRLDHRHLHRHDHCGRLDECRRPPPTTPTRPGRPGHRRTPRWRLRRRTASWPVHDCRSTTTLGSSGAVTTSRARMLAVGGSLGLAGALPKQAATHRFLGTLAARQVRC